jgi:hypothetical protein
MELPTLYAGPHSLRCDAEDLSAASATVTRRLSSPCLVSDLADSTGPSYTPWEAAAGYGTAT